MRFDDVEEQGTETGQVEGKERKPIIRYVRMATSLIEGRYVGIEEIERMLKAISRQHRLTRRRRIDYIIEKLNRGPP